MRTVNGHHDRNLLQRRSSFGPAVVVVFAVFTLGFALGFYSASPSESRQLDSNEDVIAKQTDTSCSNPAAHTCDPPHDLFQFRSDCAPPLHHLSILPTLLRRIYNHTSPFAGFPPPHAAPLLRNRRVRGWGSNAPVFEELISSVRPNIIIEVGTFLGASALHMANVTRRLGLGSTVILCLDDFRGWPGFRDQNRGVFSDIRDLNGDVMLMYQFMQNVVDAGEEKRVLPLPFSTSAGMAALCQMGVYGDLVEVDAGHDFHSAWGDINLAWAVVKTGGVLFGHDYHTAADRRGVRRAVHLFAKTKGLTVKSHGQHWVLAPRKGQRGQEMPS